MPMSTKDELAALERMASRYVPAAHDVYSKVFGESPDITTVPLDPKAGPDPLRAEAIVINDWLYLYQNGGDDWVVKVMVPDGRSFGWPCIRRMHGQLSVKSTFEDALVLALQHEAHLRTHHAMEEVRAAAAGGGAFKT